MNRLLLVVCVLATNVLWGQYSPDVSPKLQQATLDEKSWITTIGFPLPDYDYSNPTINLELATALDEKKQGDLLSKISYASIGLGALLRFAPLFVEDLELGGAFPTLLMVGGLTVNLVGMSKKLKAKKRVQNARYLFYDQ